ncbi:hypothetical protein niasHT_039872 [Heterodera trifolii]|uniref:Uncharacterized protein n=1 Tax=Heterodera trifolii TaxID=157864 RepID=A0ABD2ISV2_9BILA
MQLGQVYAEQRTPTSRNRGKNVQGQRSKPLGQHYTGTPRPNPGKNAQAKLRQQQPFKPKQVGPLCQRVRPSAKTKDAKSDSH